MTACHLFLILYSMSKQTRKVYPPKFKLQVVLELLSNKQTVSQICSKHSIHPTMLSNWKTQFLAEAEKIFERWQDPNIMEEKKQKEREINELTSIVGQYSIENTWLKKKYRELGLILPEIGIGK